MAEARLSSVRNAVRVLRAFSSRHKSWGVSDLARELDLSTSTTHRLLATLVDEHLVEKDAETGKYQLGLAVYDLVAARSAGYDLSEAVLPPMTLLRQRTGETVQVAVLDGREVVYVERLESPNTLRLFLDVGRRNWAHATGTGKVLLAHLHRLDLDRVLDGWEMAQITAHTFTDHDLLRKELTSIRDQGYAHNQEESELGVLSVGAPIRDAAGDVVAAMSVAGPSQRMSPHMQAITYGVMEAAAVASRRLGHRPGGARL